MEAPFIHNESLKKFGWFFHIYAMNVIVINFLAYFTMLSPHINLFMMYINLMTNYQFKHFQIFCDVVKNTSTTIAQIGLQILTIIHKKNIFEWLVTINKLRFLL